LIVNIKSIQLDWFLLIQSISSIFLIAVLIVGLVTSPVLQQSGIGFAYAEDEVDEIEADEIEEEEIEDEGKGLKKEERGKPEGKGKPENKVARQSEIESEDYDDNDIQEFGDDVEIALSSKTVTLCHIPPGNPSKAHTITVGKPAARAHEAHGDNIEGPCDGFTPSTTDRESKLAEKQARLAEKHADKLTKTSQRAEDHIQKLEQRIAELEQRLQTLLAKVETGEYFGNVPQVDSVIKSYSISLDGRALSIFDESVTTDFSGEIFIENLMTNSKISKFRVTGGEIFVGDNIYDVVFGKARVSSSGPSGEKDSMILIVQAIDSEGNRNTIRLSLDFDSALEGEFGTESINVEIMPRSKISGEWLMRASGQLSLV